MKPAKPLNKFREKIQFAAIRAQLFRERICSGAVFNPVSDRMTRDPYPEYAKLRSLSPAHRSSLMGALVFSRHADVKAILRDSQRFSSDPARKGETQHPKLPRDAYTMLILEPPDHTRLRALVNPAFGRRKIDALEPLIRNITRSLLDEIADPSRFDLMTAIANPLPVLAIAEILGIPSGHRGWLRRWSSRGVRLLEPAGGGENDAVTAALDTFFHNLVERAGEKPGKDITSVLAEAESAGGGEAPSRREILNMLRLLFVTGNETTANLIGNGMLALFRQPEKLGQLRDDPGLIPGAVEELLRFDSPIQTAFRFVVDDCDFNGLPLRRGQSIVLLIGAANRDPSAFEHADELNLLRPRSGHVAFGSGIHRCLGASLARLEGRIALEMLLERFASMRPLDTAPRYRRGVVLRGLESLTVEAVPA